MATQAPTSQNKNQGVDIATLPTATLSQLQQRLSQELEHLTTSHQRLRTAQSQFRDCIRSVKEGVQGREQGTSLLIPLTASLYIPGTLSKTSHVLVDVGTGFYVEKTTSDAITFYNAKVAGLDQNLGEIERAVGSKSESLRVVEGVLREKVLMEQEQGVGQGQGVG